MRWIWHIPCDLGSGCPPCRSTRCSIVVQVSLRRSKLSSTGRSIWFACAGTAKRVAIRCASNRRAAKSILTIPPRGTLKEAREFAQKHGGWIAARLDRLPKAAPFADGTVVPLRGVPHRIEHRGPCAARSGPRRPRTGECLICVAGRAPHLDRRVGDFLRREAKRDLETASRHFANELGVAGQAGRRPRSVEPLGLVLDDRHTIVFLAAHSGAEHGAKLSCRARSGASRRNESLATILASGAATVPGP